MFQTVIEAGADGSLLEEPGAISKSSTRTVVLDKHLSHFNVHALGDPASAARWSNALQAMAETTPHGIPVTVSTDPRHAFMENAGVSFSAGAFSQWPEPLGLAALARRRRRAHRSPTSRGRSTSRSGSALPCTRPSTSRRSRGGPGRPARSVQDPDLVTELGLAYLQGFQGDALGPGSVACTSKHFPGGGPAAGRGGRALPLRPRAGLSRRPIRRPPASPSRRSSRRARRGSCPTTVCRSTSRSTGSPSSQVGFGYNQQVVTGLLREQLGYDGVVVTDWELVNDNHVGDQVLPARAWGVEHLDPPGRMELHPRGRGRPVRRRGVRRDPARPGGARAGSPRRASTSRRGGCSR